MKIQKIEVNGITFDDGSTLEDYHDQSCCEHVYADWENMQVMTRVEGNSVDAKDLEFFEDVINSIVPIKDLGFYLVTKNGICILVSCYNQQNGYYSSELALYFNRGVHEYIMDISECVCDDIY